MKRSEINEAFVSASSFFTKNHWNLPPDPEWDITDFGLGEFSKFGLVLINLAQEKEYCEKLMYAKLNQRTPLHFHKDKKEDIICRNGYLSVILQEQDYLSRSPKKIRIKVNGREEQYIEGTTLFLKAGERITIEPLLWHTFFPSSEECIIGEVSTSNNDMIDNFFENELIGRFPEIVEDEPAKIELLKNLVK